MITSIDHFVLTCADVDATIDFYVRVLGMTAESFGAGRRALSFGNQKINLHQAGAEFEPKARVATPGSGDSCLLSALPVADIPAHLAAGGAAGWPGGSTRMARLRWLLEGR